MTKTRCWTLTLSITALVVALSADGFVLGKGKPQPEPDPPPIHYQITWIIAPGMDSTRPWAINIHGEAVGNTDYPFIYTAAGGVVNLNTLIDPLSGWELTSANDINDAGQIVGAGLINAESHAFRYTPAGTDGQGQPVDAVVEDLGKLDASHVSSSALAINNFGEVCGSSNDSTGVSHPFYYTNANGMTEIEAGGDARATDINNSGQIVGTRLTDSLGFRYTHGTNTIEFLSSPDGNDSPTSAYAINDSGQFVGQTQFVKPKGKNKQDLRAYRYSDGQNAEGLGAAQDTSARGINNDGDVVVRQQFGRGSAYLEEFQTLVNFDDAVTGPEADLWHSSAEYLAGHSYPYDINEDGQITGWITNPYGTGGSLGFILTPVSP